VVYSFVLASPAGSVTDATAGWDVCQTPKPPAENNSVASACNPPAPGPDYGTDLRRPGPDQRLHVVRARLRHPFQWASPAIQTT